MKLEKLLQIADINEQLLNEGFFDLAIFLMNQHNLSYEINEARQTRQNYLRSQQLQESVKIQQMRQKVISLLSEAYLEIDDKDSTSELVNPVNTDLSYKKRKIDSFIKQLQQFGMTKNDIEDILTEPDANYTFDDDDDSTGYKVIDIWGLDEYAANNVKKFTLFDGSENWLLGDQLHRIGAPAIKRLNGDEIWYRYGKLDRLDGPAVKFGDGTEEWYLNGELHRRDGPAVQRPDGTKEYWLFGEQLEDERLEDFLKYLASQQLQESRKIHQIKQKVMSLLSEAYLEIDDNDINNNIKRKQENGYFNK
jgi:hypothetical protein